MEQQTCKKRKVHSDSQLLQKTQGMGEEAR